VLGYFDYSSGLATAGTYASAPTNVCVAGHDVALPGQAIQSFRTSETGKVDIGTAVIPLDDTAPAIGEGTLAMTRAISPIFATSVLEIRAQALVNSEGGDNLIGALFRDSTCIAAGAVSINTSDETDFIELAARERADVTSSLSYTVRLGSQGGATVYLNGRNAARLFGGVANSFLEVRELVA
jgi:hypothetical protein